MKNWNEYFARRQAFLLLFFRKLKTTSSYNPHLMILFLEFNSSQWWCLYNAYVRCCSNFHLPSHSLHRSRMHGKTFTINAILCSVSHSHTKYHTQCTKNNILLESWNISRVQCLSSAYSFIACYVHLNCFILCWKKVILLKSRKKEKRYNRMSYSQFTFAYIALHLSVTFILGWV